MSKRALTAAGLAAVGMGLGPWSGPLSAQSQAIVSRPPTKRFTAPKTPWGHPDLQGT